MKIQYLFSIFIFLFLSQIVLSQEQPIPDKKSYISEEGKFYVNKTLPVYLWLSTSNDSVSEKFKLRSDTMPQYTNPMYFDADGFNSVRTRGLVHNKTRKVVDASSDIFFPVYGDSRPPESYTIIQSSSVKWKEGKRVYKDEMVVDILSYDMFSGIEDIYYSINGEAFKVYEGQLKIEGEGEYNLKYYAVDHVGNLEQPREIQFIIEKSTD